MYKRRALAALLLLALGCCSRHEHLTPINYSPPASAESSELGIRTAIVQQSITSYKGPWDPSYKGPCPCPYSGSDCPGRSAYDKPSGQPVYCYTKDVAPDMVNSYRATLASRPSSADAAVSLFQ
jgi:hypothetical protein